MEPRTDDDPCEICGRPLWTCEGHEPSSKELQEMVDEYRSALEEIAGMEDGETVHLFYEARRIAREALGWEE